MNQRKPKKNKKSRGKFNSPEEEASYEKLVADIGGLTDGLKAQGIDPFPRTDILTCQSCGAYESISFEGLRFIVHKNGQPVKDGLDILMHPERYPAAAMEKLFDGMTEEEAEKKIRNMLTPESFIVIDSKETSRTLKNRKFRCRMTYSFICSVCGAQQKEMFVEDFDPL